VLPDVRACIFWLRNRQPQEWRENRSAVDEAGPSITWEDLEEASRRAARRHTPPEVGERNPADASLAATAERLRVNL
jgi:hypothetical protein